MACPPSAVSPLPPGGRADAGRGLCACAAASRLPPTRPSLLQKGGSSQGASLFWPSAMKRNLPAPPTSDPRQQRMAHWRAPAALAMIARKGAAAAQRQQEQLPASMTSPTGLIAGGNDGIHLSAASACVHFPAERLPCPDVSCPGV